MVYHDQVRFIPQIQDWSNICKSTDLTHHVSGIKGKIPHNLNKYKKKKIWQNQTFFHDENTQQTRDKRKSQPDKGCLWKILIKISL